MVKFLKSLMHEYTTLNEMSFKPILGYVITIYTRFILTRRNKEIQRELTTKNSNHS